MLHVFLAGDRAELVERALQVARDEKVYLFGDLDETDVPGWSMFETVVVTQKSDLADDEIRRFFERIVKDSA